MKRNWLSIVIFSSVLLVLEGCVPTSSGGGGAKRTPTSLATPVAGDGSSGQGSTGSDDYIDDIDLEDYPLGFPEIRQVVDPFTGTYKIKTTIPKNYKGKLYFAGLNITSLAGQHNFVRFKFGMGRESIILPATIAQTQGITPEIAMDVVVVHVNQEFKNLRLPYDLYDYNAYAAGEAPTQDPRDGGLYCRGLYLEDDPTFTTATVSDQACNSAGEKCYYAYAKVLDSGLRKADGTFIVPTVAQIATSTTGYGSDAVTNAKRCLSDKDSAAERALIFSGLGLPAGHTYVAPYRAVDSTAWQISGAAVTGVRVNDVKPTAIFQSGLTQSYLFPVATQMQLVKDVEHLQNETLPFGPRTLKYMDASGASGWMDGCNARITTLDPVTNEHIGSCTVTATIELLTRDSVGNYNVIANTNGVKIQLTKASMTDYLGNDLLFSSSKTCVSSTGCSANECCYNKRCWSKDLVSQCLEDNPSTGQKDVGATCSTDYQCKSLCCDTSLGVCAVHEYSSTATDPKQCSKLPGDKCVSSLWCKQEDVIMCDVYRIGSGPKDCAIRCPIVKTYGTCLNGTCKAPTTPAIPILDATNPCTNAKTLPIGY